MRAFGALTLLCASATAAPVEFNRDIRPILNDACLACHGADSASREAGLRLDRRDEAIAAGVLAPGDPEASEALRRVTTEDEAERMPPPESKKTLTPGQIDLLRRWVLEGAEYEPHWAFITPKRMSPPEHAHQRWRRNAIDDFVAARLEREKLAPRTEAPRLTLLRRVTLDLTGLPPTPEEIVAFRADVTPGAYERVVDRLLASPRWGEHRARYWLDVARYGDTHGIHIDNYREMWPYRDWVIQAFNDNLPFDEFTRKNLAGDLLPNATLQDRIASGFNRCNITTGEGGAIDAEYAALYTRDRTETTSTAWMGLTAGCAVCHDHKYDPLSQREFYELAAFFNNTTQPAMDGNLKDTPPVVVVYTAEDQRRHESLVAKRDSIRQELRKRREANPEQTVEARPSDSLPPEAFVAPLDEGTDELSSRFNEKTHTQSLGGRAEWQGGPFGRKSLKLLGKSALDAAEVGSFTANDPFTLSLWMKAPAVTEAGAVVGRMGMSGWDLWWDQGRLAVHLVHHWPTDALKVITKSTLPRDRWVHVVATYDGGGKAAGVRLWVDGVEQSLKTEADCLAGSLATDAPLSIGSRDGESGVKFLHVTQVRLYGSAFTPQEVSAAADAWLDGVLQRPEPERTPAEAEALSDWRLRVSDTEYAAQAEALAACEHELDVIAARNPVTHVMQERDTPATAQVLRRGEYDQPGETVSPGTPSMLPPLAEGAPRNRLGLAQWLLDPSHPLTSRVAVNRCWQELFGVGLVATPGDFGLTGELPSHPELLDWLAVEFRESGWNVKWLYRLMVTSATYCQSAIAPSDHYVRDPENRLLARGSRQRLDAEMLRDQALASSGLLVERLGGPSVKPYQPEGVWESVTMPGSDTFKYLRDDGDALYRRSLYTFWKRSAPPAALETLNAPSREACVMRRECTNTPMQALVTLNDPQFVEAARALAQRSADEGGAGAERLEWIALRVLSRPLKDDERGVLLELARELQADFTASPAGAEGLLEVGDSPTPRGAAAPELAAWTMVASAVLNLDEALHR